MWLSVQAYTGGQQKPITQKLYRVKALHDFEGESNFLLQKYSHELL